MPLLRLPPLPPRRLPVLLRLRPVPLLLPALPRLRPVLLPLPVAPRLPRSEAFASSAVVRDHENARPGFFPGRVFPSTLRRQSR
jgi:hypothetical protein